MVDLMGEFGVTVLGMAFVMETAAPEKKRVTGQRSLMVMDMLEVDDEQIASVRPAKWLEA